MQDDLVSIVVPRDAAKDLKEMLVKGMKVLPNIGPAKYARDQINKVIAAIDKALV